MASDVLSTAAMLVLLQKSLVLHSGTQVHEGAARPCLGNIELERAARIIIRLLLKIIECFASISTRRTIWPVSGLLITRSRTCNK